MRIDFRDAQTFIEHIYKQGYSMRSLGRAAGISGEYMIQLCNEDRHPSPRVAKSICDVLDLRFDDLFVVIIDRKRNQTESA